MAAINTKLLSDGTPRYRVIWREGGRTGKPQTVTLDDLRQAETFKALVDAHRNLMPPASSLRDAGFGFLLAPEPAAPTAPSFVHYALSYVDLTRASADTRAGYRRLIRRDLEPYWRDTPLTVEHVTRGRLRDWQQWMTAAKDAPYETALGHTIPGRGLAAKSVRNTRGSVVEPPLKHACRPGENGEPPLLPYNPCDDALPAPAGRSVPRRIIESSSDAELLLTCAYEFDPDSGDLIAAMLGTGMRWGEVTGLPPTAVYPEALKLEIIQVAVRNRACDPRLPALYLRPEPKTPAGFRTLPLVQGLGEMFARRIDASAVRRQRRSRRPVENVVFPACDGGLLGSQNWRRDKWVPILAMARARGLKHDVTPHGLRKSVLTLLAELNVDPVTLKQFAGHSRHQTTLDLYTQVTGRGFPTVRTAIDGFLGSVPAA